jgi:hypothetical protein
MLTDSGLSGRSTSPDTRPSWVSPQITAAPMVRRRVIDRKKPPTVAELVEVRSLYFRDGLAIWAIARMMRMSPKAVGQIIQAAATSP